jgi:membrane protein YqaA with SNARE-associated domain
MLSDFVTALRAWADGAGAAGIFVVAFVDSVGVSVPSVTDALVLYLSVQQPLLWWWYAAAAVAGALLGSIPLYWIGRRGGEALLQRRFNGPRMARAMTWYRRSAFGTILVPAFLPPPLPFKIFAVLAGATGLALWRFALALSLGRGARHAAEGAFAAMYGPQAVVVFQTRGVEIAAGIAVAALVTAAAMWWRRGGRRASAHA